MTNGTTDNTKNAVPDPAGDLASNLSEADLSRIWLDHYNQRVWDEDSWEDEARACFQKAKGLGFYQGTLLKPGLNGKRQSILSLVAHKHPDCADDFEAAAKETLVIANEVGLQGEPRKEPPDIPKMLYYREKDRFCYKAPDGHWTSLCYTTAARLLNVCGMSDEHTPGRPSAIEEYLVDVMQNHVVDWIGPLAGYSDGPCRQGDMNILVTRSIRLIEPKAGDWSIISKILDGMLSKEQRPYMYATLKFGYEAYRDGSDRPVPMIVLCGPASGDGKQDCAWKSAFAKRIICPVWGGRMVDASRYLLGRTEFNSDLFACETLLLDDIKAYGNWLSRHDLSEQLKSILVGATHSLHAKGKDAVPLHPRWRVVMTLNDDDEALRQLPDFAENFKEKAHLFKVREFELPMPNRTTAEWQALDAKIASQLPAFIYDMLHWEIPKAIRSDRFGVRAYHDPELMEALYEMSNEQQLASLMEIALVRRTKDGAWTGSAEELRAELVQHHAVGKQAEKLLGWPNATGTLLGKLQKREPDKYVFKRVGPRRESTWTVYLDSQEKTEVEK